MIKEPLLQFSLFTGIRGMGSGWGQLAGSHALGSHMAPRACLGALSVVDKASTGVGGGGWL